MSISLNPEQIAMLLEPYLDAAALAESAMRRLGPQLQIYLELLMRWNERLNLTAIRTPEEIVRRHFGESLFAGAHLPSDCASLLDFGSGGGFPGVPIQLLRPTLAVTLAESRQKKAAFLREAIRELQLPTEVWAGRVEEMPPARKFDVVALRAVDNMESAIAGAATRAACGVLILATGTADYAGLLSDFALAASLAIPESADRRLLTYIRS